MSGILDYRRSHDVAVSVDHNIGISPERERKMSNYDFSVRGPVSIMWRFVDNSGPSVHQAIGNLIVDGVQAVVLATISRECDNAVQYDGLFLIEKNNVIFVQDLSADK